MGTYIGFSNSVGATHGALLNQIPAANLATMWLDGSIVDVSGSKYFVNKKGDNVLITGYDFPSGWVRGFPYKSAATIDVFGQTGVPVVSLFQNFDYENKYFCRHAAQVVDENGVETYEPRVLDIVAYGSALTGEDLTKANAFYGVPNEDVNAVWVSKTGNDTTGSGSKAAPYLTIVKAYTVVNDGRTIYVKSGAYSETVYSLNDCQLQCIGFVDFTPTSGGYGIRWRYDTKDLIAGIKINPGNAITSGIYGQSAINLVISNIYLNSSAGTGINGDYKSIIDCVLIGTVTTHYIANATGSQERTIVNSYIYTGGGNMIYNPASMGKLTVKNNRLLPKTSRIINNLNASAGIDFIGNYVKSMLDLQNVIIVSSGDFPNLNILDNIFDINGGVADLFQFTGYVTNMVTIKRNKITTGSNLSETIFAIINCNLVAENNIINIEASEPSAYGDILSTVSSNVAVSQSIKNNKILSKRTGGYNIGVGSEGTSVADNCMTSIEISCNYIKGRHAYADPSTNNTHGLFVGYQINAAIKHNLGYGLGYAVVLKGIATTIYTSNGVTYNVFKDFKRGVYLKGANSVNIFNNTFVSSNLPDYAVRLDENAGSDAASNGIIKNNIFICLETGTYNAVQFLNGSADNVSDYNIFYCPNGTLNFTDGATSYTFAEWQAHGQDTHSIVLTDAQFNAMFTNFANDDYSLAAGSAAIGAGVALDAAYDDGLDASTVWGADTVLPVIVTKKQAAAWDCGAYVH